MASTTPKVPVLFDDVQAEIDPYATALMAAVKAKVQAQPDRPVKPRQGKKRTVAEMDALDADEAWGTHEGGAAHTELPSPSSSSDLSSPPGTPDAETTVSSAVDDDEDDEDTTDDLKILEEDPSRGDGELDDKPADATTTNSTGIFDLCDQTFSDVLDILKKHGYSAEVKAAIHFAISGIQREWGANAADKKKEELISSAQLAVRKEGEVYVFGMVPDELDQLVRYEVAGAIGKILLGQQWTPVYGDGRTRTGEVAVKEKEVSSLNLIRRGMDAVMDEVRSTAGLPATTEEDQDEEMLVEDEEMEDLEDDDDEEVDEGITGPAFTPINGPVRGPPPKKRQRVEGASIPELPKIGRKTASSGLASLGAATTSSPAKGTKTKSGVKKEEDDGETKTRAKGCGKRWAPEESLFAVTKWWTDDLKVDEAKRTNPDGTQVKIPDRVQMHNDWLKAQGGDASGLSRTWAGMEQRIKELKKAGKTASVLRAEIAAKAAAAAAPKVPKKRKPATKRAATAGEVADVGAQVASGGAKAKTPVAEDEPVAGEDATEKEDESMA